MRRPSLGHGLYFNRRGEPIDDAEYMRLMMQRASYGQVAEDHVGESRVSTVWLGLNHAMPGEPLEIFESMVFGGPLDSALWRWSTEDEALAGHATVVRAVQDAQPPRSGSREEPILPDDDRPLASPEPGSIDISGLDKAELLAALANATTPPPFRSQPVTHEQAAALIQDQLGGAGGRPFSFDYVAGRPIKCDMGGPRLSAFHVALYDRDAGQGTLARVVSELRAAYERRRAERQSS